jgi:hypothetical protein
VNRFKIGDRVTTLHCPSEGTVLRAEYHGLQGIWEYVMDWPDFPDDNRIYVEGELKPAPAPGERWREGPAALPLRPPADDRVDGEES